MFAMIGKLASVSIGIAIVTQAVKTVPGPTLSPIGDPVSIRILGKGIGPISASASS